MKSKISAETGRAALRALLREGSPLGPLKVMAQHVGRFFQIPLPGFRPYVVFGPEANRKVLVTERDKVLWRNTDPVTDLLRRGASGLLVGEREPQVCDGLIVIAESLVRDCAPVIENRELLLVFGLRRRGLGLRL